MESSNVVLSEEFKKMVDAKIKAGEQVAGLTFVNSKGSVGTILPTLSARGKLQASMTCVEGGPDHIRERSDWHQCYLSPEKSKNRPRKTGGPGAGKSMRLDDGTLIRFQDITPSDSAEIVAAKESNNRAFEAAQALKHQSDLDAKAEKDEARRILKEIKAQARRQEKEAVVAAKLAAGVQKLREYTASLSTKVEPAQQLPNQSW